MTRQETPMHRRRPHTVLRLILVLPLLVLITIWVARTAAALSILGGAA